jgi:hypothetical protein
MPARRTSSARACRATGDAAACGDRADDSDGSRSISHATDSSRSSTSRHLTPGLICAATEIFTLLHIIMGAHGIQRTRSSCDEDLVWITVGSAWHGIEISYLASV